MKTQSSEQTKKLQEVPDCYHCGDACTKVDIEVGDKHFCCQGCKTVYELLEENGLCNYYDLDEQARQINKEDISTGQQYAFLDEEEIREQVVDYEDQKIGRTELAIPSIHCSSCIYLLEKLQRFLPGIISSQVNFSRKSLYVIYSTAEVGLSQICRLLARLGYPPVINLDSGNQESKPSLNKDLLLKIGVAGFAAGNIMLLSFPEYFELEGIADGLTEGFFRWLNLVLSLPVVFYSASGYLKSAWAALRSKHVNIDVPLSIGIVALFLRSLIDVFWLQQSGYFDTLVGLVFFLLVGKWFQERVYDRLSFDRDYKSFLPLSATRLDTTSNEHEATDKVKEVMVSQLAKGDVIEVRHKGLVPVDSILLSASSQGDLSFITGEAEPVPFSKGDYIYAGTKILGTRVSLSVQKPVDQSYLSRLWEGMDAKKAASSGISSFADVLSTYFVYATLAIALVSGLVWWFVNPSMVWPVITSVLIVACPCALALSSPFLFGTGMTLLGRTGFYLKNPEVLRKLAELDVALFDKTGTLSEKQTRSVNWKGSVLSATEQAAILCLAQQSNHPASQAIVEHLKNETEWEPVTESSWKDKPVVSNFQEHAGQGIEGYIGTNQVLLGKWEFVGGTKTNQTTGSAVHVSYNGEYKGVFQIERNYRKGLTCMMEQFFNKGMEVSVVSGDHTGDYAQLKRLLPAHVAYFFHAQPHEKKSMVEGLKAKGKRVLMVGDGINDAGALQKADVGLAITDTLSGFSPASDGILLGKKLPDLHTYLSYSSRLRTGVYLAFAISLLYNITGLGFAIAGLLSPLVCAILMPLSSITVVAFGVAYAHLTFRSHALN